MKLETKLILALQTSIKLLQKAGSFIEEIGYLVVLVLYDKTAIKL